MPSWSLLELHCKASHLLEYASLVYELQVNPSSKRLISHPSPVGPWASYQQQFMSYHSPYTFHCYSERQSTWYQGNGDTLITQHALFTESPSENYVLFWGFFLLFGSLYLTATSQHQYYKGGWWQCLLSETGPTVGMINFRKKDKIYPKSWWS